MLRSKIYEKDAEELVASWLDGYLVLDDFDAQLKDS